MYRCPMLPTKTLTAVHFPSTVHNSIGNNITTSMLISFFSVNSSNSTTATNTCPNNHNNHNYNINDDDDHSNHYNYRTAAHDSK